MLKNSSFNYYDIMELDIWFATEWRYNKSKMHKIPNLLYKHMYTPKWPTYMYMYWIGYTYTYQYHTGTYYMYKKAFPTAVSTNYACQVMSKAHLAQRTAALAVVE